MYAVAVESFGQMGNLIPCGNDGMQKLHNKTHRGWMKETECMRKRTTGRVYVISDFTQAMCEMEPGQLAEYVCNHNIARLK